MKKKSAAGDDPLDREIDFTNARPNRHFAAYHGPRVIRVLEPDLAEIFPDNKAVNAALRTIADAANRTTRVSARRVAAPRTRAKKSTT